MSYPAVPIPEVAGITGTNRLAKLQVKSFKLLNNTSFAGNRKTGKGYINVGKH